MSPLALRWLAFPLGLVAFLARLALILWVIPLTWSLSSANAFLAELGMITLLLMGCLAPLAALTSASRRKARMRLDGGRFTLDPSPMLAANELVVLMAISATFVPTERGEGDTMRIASQELAGRSWPVGIALFWAIGLVFLLVLRPRLYLDREGLTVRRVLSTTRVEWSRLEPGGPARPGKRNVRYLRVRLTDPPVDGRYQADEDIPVGWLHAESAYVADVIRYYADHPEERAGIGTPEGLERLRFSLS